MKLLLLITALAIVNADESAQKQSPAPEQRARQIVYYTPQPALPYDGHINQQFFPGFQHDRTFQQRLEPQVLVYPGGAGQPFLLQPGSPPGNFLIPQPQPQPGPGIVYRDGPGGFGNDQPQRPIFVAGYPKPAHIPKIEPEAEEVPTDPQSIPPFKPQKIGTKTPAKIETFNEVDSSTPAGKSGSDVENGKRYNNQGKKPIPTIPPLQPNQRFFVLNGQQLFSNYPDIPQIPPQPYHPVPNLKSNVPVYPQPQPENNFINPNHEFYNPYVRQPYDPSLLPQILQNFNQQSSKASPGQVPVQDLFLRNSVTGQISNVNPDFARTRPIEQPFQHYPEQIPQNLIHYQQPQHQIFRTAPLPIAFGSKNQPQELIHSQQPLQSRFNEDGIQLEPIVVQNEGGIPLYDHNLNQGADALQYFRYDGSKYDGSNDDDSVVIDAKSQDKPETTENDSEEITTPPSKSEEPSIAQAQPGAIALAGPGGVAAAGPRGTALAGIGGLAVSSPRATAVAGPKDDEEKKNKKETKTKQ